ncbi:hypothetical protein [Comamonas aquatica]|uniref:hypothetical protein n=1 Tax=Comamonas aquatica TaxID=225991 RepID=UPI00244CE65A|nr:hypothetical protein [Comamonas aquatica]MDH0200693.1 hypothetical protein [Comamonas aquatica]MDH1445565.1 hypothetical protein [Comamonas aquatica]
MTDAKPFPMLAAAADLKKVQYPVLGFPTRKEGLLIALNKISNQTDGALAL